MPTSASDPRYIFVVDNDVIGTCARVEIETLSTEYRMTLIGWKPEKSDGGVDLVGTLDYSIGTANRMRQQLVEQGWSYEAAEDIAGTLLKNIFKNAFEGDT